MSLTKLLPSGSTDGSPVKIVATATAGTLWHTAVAGTAQIDEIYGWLTNTSASDVVVTCEYGAATAPDFNVKFTVPANDTIMALGGVPLQNGKTVRFFAATANVVNVFGHVIRGP